MELGGNAPYIVFNDANIDDAIAGILANKYRNAGQTCICANRIFVQADIYDSFLSRLKTEIMNLKMGDGTDHEVNIGPLINIKAAQNVRNIIQDAIDKGAQMATGTSLEAENESNFIPPTILTHATTDMRVFTDEIFGLSLIHI